MTSVIYASFSAFLITWLSLNVIKLRRTHRISHGDGGNEALRIAVSAHANATQYIPITLLLLFAMEYNGAGKFLVHAFGVVFIIGRFIHARGVLAARLKPRVLGMHMTLWTIIGLAVVNFVYVPYQALLSF